jgi:hypothetical protein
MPSLRVSFFVALFQVWFSAFSHRIALLLTSYQHSDGGSVRASRSYIIKGASDAHILCWDE